MELVYVFEYSWHHIPTNNKGMTKAGSFSKDPRDLINDWNQSNDWKYVLISSSKEVIDAKEFKNKDELIYIHA
jgi:hypothetical protein